MNLISDRNSSGSLLYRHEKNINNVPGGCSGQCNLCTVCSLQTQTLDQQLDLSRREVVVCCCVAGAKRIGSGGESQPSVGDVHHNLLALAPALSALGFLRVVSGQCLCSPWCAGLRSWFYLVTVCRSVVLKLLTMSMPPASNCLGLCYYTAMYSK